MELRDTSLAEALAAGPVVLDGGLATRLEARGHDLSDPLWSARLLLDEPDEVEAAHRDFVRAGARVVTTASYQLSADGLAAVGRDPGDLADALTRGVGLARAATEEASATDGTRRWVAASVGPYGAACADGSEYTGAYGLTIRALRAWHRPRIALLLEAGADVLALETVPGVVEAEALLAEVSGTGVPVWLSLTCAGERTRSGDDPDEAWELARDVAEVVAVGVNCTAPGDVLPLVEAAAEVTGKPVVCYPNSGEGWDPAARAWVGSSDFAATDLPTRVGDWVGAGARLVGGCCRVTPDDVARLAAALP